jgi:hypothetical protein
MILGSDLQGIEPAKGCTSDHQSTDTQRFFYHLQQPHGGGWATQLAEQAGKRMFEKVNVPS